jgi:hypothetical protein
VVVVHCASPRQGSPDARLAPKAAVRDTQRTMADEPTTPDLVELTRQLHDALSPRDLDCFVGFFAPDAVWEQAGAATLEGAAEIREFA